LKQIILGTAGHIDHGKTSLIKAVTGTDTDRLKEEKERGIGSAQRAASGDCGCARARKIYKKYGGRRHRN
jgi:selenocysteine-specific elongation factor